MKYRVCIKWNGSIVLDGTCTAVMAYGLLKGLADNFGSPVKAGFVLPTLMTLIDTEKGTIFSNDAHDDTGVSEYTLLAIGDEPIRFGER